MYGKQQHIFSTFVCYVMTHVCVGQIIPRGLHVRLNLETGEREAKLLSDDAGSRSRESAGYFSYESRNS